MKIKKSPLSSPPSKHKKLKLKDFQTIQTTEVNTKNFNTTNHGFVNSISNVQVVLIVCIALTLMLFILGIIWCIWMRKMKSGYDNLPNNEPKEDESAEEVISEIIGRREVVLPPVRAVSTLSSKLGPQSDETMGPNPSSNSQHSASSIGPAQPNTSELYKLGDLPSPPEQGSKIPTESSLIVLDHDKHSPSLQCPSSKPGSIRLLPHSRLHNPFSSHKWQEKNKLKASTSSSEPSFTKVSMDEILSLSTIERSRSRTEMVLTPQITPSTGHILVDLTETPKVQSKEFDPSVELTLEEKKEEWDKFLRAFSNNVSSRRRSLCRVEELQNMEVLPNAIATKVKSMPAMSVGPFTSSTAHDLEILNHECKELRSPTKTCAIPVSLQYSPLGNLYKKISSMSLSTNELEEMSNAFALLTQLSKGSKLPPSPKTSTTSIWSSVASENAYEPDRASLCSRATSLEEMPVLWGKIKTGSDSSSMSAEDFDESISEGHNLHLRTRNGSSEVEVKRLTTAERIDLAAKLLGYVSPDGSTDSGFLIESDLIPSKLFSKSRESSAVSSNDQFWITDVVSILNQQCGKQVVDPSNFWAQGVVGKSFSKEQKKNIDEEDPYRITSKLQQALKVSKARSLENLQNIYHNAFKLEND